MSNDTPQPAFDLQEMRQNLMDDDDLVHAILESFLENTPSLLEDLQKALESLNKEECARYSHSIKGVAASVGGKRVYETSALMEQWSGEGRLTEVKDYYPKLLGQFEELCELAKAELGDSGEL